MRAERALAWVLCVGMFGSLAGCATRGSVRRVEGEVAALSKRVEELQQLNESTTRELARMTAELKELQSGTARLAREREEAAQQVSRVDARLADSEATIRELRTSVSDLSREMNRLAARPPAPEPAPGSGPSRPGSPEQVYAAAVAQMRAGEHGQAVVDFLDFQAKFPKHPLASSAQYWIGEAYYVQRDFRQALMEFQKVAGQYPKSDKAADALFKIGLCYRALHDPAKAREAWDKLIAEFPRSEAAKKAGALLKPRPAPSARSR
jgi:tol-pal system protein YbgF